MRHIVYLWLIIAAITTGILIMLVTLPVQIRIIYEGHGRSHKVQLGLELFNGRVRLNTKWPPPGPTRPKASPNLTRKRAVVRYKSLLGSGGVSLLIQWRRLRQMITVVRRSLGVLRSFMRRSVCTRLRWETGFGLDDYAATGLTAGLIWAGKGLLIGFFSRYLRINSEGVRIVVAPQFGNLFYQSNLDCILETSLGYIMIVVLKLCMIWLLKRPGILLRRKRYA
ncbi:MAG: DUF2953 domain-containing protein [Thermacetogeniaceae bacterium]